MLGMPECRRGWEGGSGGELWGHTCKTPKVPGTCLLCPQITSLQQEGEELSGQARCPFDATQSNVAIFAGVNLGM